MSCQHIEVLGGRHGAYCRACGERVDDAPLGWNKPLEPGPVRLPTREELMQDSRVANWHAIDSVPADRPVIITRPCNGQWLIKRSYSEPRFIFGLMATHWAEDTIGAPAAS